MCCSVEKTCVSNSVRDISMGVNIIVGDYVDKQIMLPAISLSYNDDDTINNRVKTTKVMIYVLIETIQTVIVHT